MMMSEFIELTGFEPTAEEYRAIEDEYMGAPESVTKDIFCKDWKKNGGIQRMMRQRARRIEDLEHKLVISEKTAVENTERRNARYATLATEKNNEIARYIEEKKERNAYINDLELRLFEMTKKANEAERKLAVVKEAFEILNGGDTDPAVSDKKEEER